MNYHPQKQSLHMGCFTGACADRQCPAFPAATVQPHALDDRQYSEHVIHRGGPGPAAILHCSCGGMSFLPSPLCMRCPRPWFFDLRVLRDTDGRQFTDCGPFPSHIVGPLPTAPHREELGAFHCHLINVSRACLEFAYSRRTRQEDSFTSGCAFHGQLTWAHSHPLHRSERQSTLTPLQEDRALRGND